MNERVCSIVVTFNRKHMLVECLNAILKQSRSVQGIYIIDNASTDGTPSLLFEAGYIDELPPYKLSRPWHKSLSTYTVPKKNASAKSNIVEIHYVRMSENTGGAGGFHEGLKRAYSDNFDWLWLMDDDGQPDIYCLQTLLMYHDSYDVLCPVIVAGKDADSLSFPVYDSFTKYHLTRLKKLKREVFIDSANPFNGTLISRHVVAEIGFPKKEMFIWGDEIEYLLRVQRKNFRIATISKALFYHPPGRIECKAINSRLSINWQKHPLKNYCDIRNTTYIKTKYFGWVSVFKYFTLYNVAFLTGKLSITEYIFFLKAFFHGFLGKWGYEKKNLLDV